jgi:hypothetical protein
MSVPFLHFCQKTHKRTNGIKLDLLETSLKKQNKNIHNKENKNYE